MCVGVCIFFFLFLFLFFYNFFYNIGRLGFSRIRWVCRDEPGMPCCDFSMCPS